LAIQIELIKEESRLLRNNKNKWGKYFLTNIVKRKNKKEQKENSNQRKNHRTKIEKNKQKNSNKERINYYIMIP